MEAFLSTLADKVLGSDPGLTRLRTALRTVLTIAIILIAEAGFVQVTHALQIDTAGLSGAAATQAATANHEFLIIAMLLGAIVGLMSSFVVNDTTAIEQLKTFSLLPIVMIPALAFGLVVGGNHIVALVGLVVILASGTYLRRFGPRGFAAGMLLFMGDFFGFFMSSTIGIKHIGWLIAEILVGVVVAIIIRFVFFYPRPAKDLERVQRSYNARARKVIHLAIALFDDPAHQARATKHLGRQLLRLNETALMIDAQLGDTGAVPENTSGLQLHQRLFDLEQALTNMVRFARIIARSDIPDDQRQSVIAILGAIADRDTKSAKKYANEIIVLSHQKKSRSHSKGHMESIALYRFANSAIDLADTMVAWTQTGETVENSDTFEPSVALFNGWLPGSNAVSANASREPGRGLAGSVTLEPYARFAIQMGVAVAGAIIIGSLVSSQRFYWAVISVFVAFMGVNNTSEQIRKALFRFFGTFIGILIGSLLVDVINGHTGWSIAVILASLFLGIYLMRISYAFMVIGITVMISQLYAELGEFSNALLLLRLEETAVGAAVAIIVVSIVLPLRTRRVLNVALREYIQSIDGLIEHTTDHLLGKPHGSKTDFRDDVRLIDVSYQALIATAQPLRRSLNGSIDENVLQMMRLVTALHNYSRTLVSDIETCGKLDADLRDDMRRGSQALRHSLAFVATAHTDSPSAGYQSSSDIFDIIERQLQARSKIITKDQLVMRDLKLMDGAVGWLAESSRGANDLVLAKVNAT